MTSVEAITAIPFVDGIVYGEGPRWHGDRLWFTDGLAGRVCSAGEAGDVTVEVELARASGLGWLPDGTLVVSALFAAQLHHVDPRGNVTATYDVSDLAWSTNDLVVARDGRAYVDLYIRGTDGMTGGIGLVAPDGTVRVVATGLAVPNGLGFLPDESTLVVSETQGSRLLAFTAGADGSLGAPTVFADLGPHRHPDGLCIDSAGGVWVGCYDTGEFLRVVAGGAITHRIEIDRGWAVAPALGGHDGRTLYLVVDETTHEGLMTGTSTGRILQARVDVPGAGSP
ncbi:MULTISPECIES: SMP-30/gluconolactonase/LRE family protein [unclassified Mycolicibacterium]|uniref:SMP-30/gluconolactonase/LRE family protein n=1 Tax=unclassified Mycolicibacterium TaxID=2636767 RepID=UPI0012DFDA06|nr:MULTISPECIES: SMP-30/gluconolactonase/LRE family protein [unclassified Mycolicibacterium]MUL85602.1 SMP-30/gluconolactonase/LRE family protein [Mycolicibacterium sp. CBMA 329]MUL88634.1 SMP-30/gluconolactonase/LRE family protein [Mycolicibacterium sp. CBMA 331]MUM02071.1 SMP-30/gluconolactonase/LRE family protein [Mycolicibacterium sp. CBMA 334]MUM30093.1 SMP-30/gluconolactonase/LRE family protein [Mycolicibacterium sp. CBMA 295]MUM40281.1 SMP-30/gluconolactonase/LRE family protein [Mycolic